MGSTERCGGRVELRGKRRGERREEQRGERRGERRKEEREAKRREKQPTTAMCGAMPEEASEAIVGSEMRSHVLSPFK